MTKTYTPKLEETIRDRKWHLIDAAGLPAGKVATKVATLLRGKHKPTFAPHMDCGDFVVVVNAGKMLLTGNKADEKVYRHSQYPGGLKTTTRGRLLQQRPEEYLRRMVKRMLPQTGLGGRVIKKLKIYAAGDHPHAAQMPKTLEI